MINADNSLLVWGDSCANNCWSEVSAEQLSLGPGKGGEAGLTVPGKYWDGLEEKWSLTR